MKPTPTTSESPEILFHLRWVANIALGVGTLAGVGLACMLFVLTDASGESYGAMIQSHSIAQQRLGPALLMGGFFLLAVTAVLTWLIALYSSFRIAGPLWRLARNLETSIRLGPVKPVPIRDSDRLHAEAALLDEAVTAVSAHYASLHDEVDQALKQLETGVMTTEERRVICERLQQRLEHARI